MQIIMGFIFAVVIVVTIPIGVVCIIETIREKRDNRRRLESGNGYLTMLYTPTEYKPKRASTYTHNCINCGAPLRKDQCKCEYCDTEYF